MSRTSSFGTSSREGHDSSSFHKRHGSPVSLCTGIFASYTVRSGFCRWEKSSGRRSVWQIAPESARKVGHPAPFPVELAERVIRLFSYVGDVVLDPFVGSGTTCVAAVKSGRHYVGYDISPAYRALADERIAAARKVSTDDGHERKPAEDANDPET